LNTTDTINAKLTPGEFVIKREAVNMIGEPFLNALNNMPEAGGGHAEIDKLIAMASMANSQNMNMGGPVEEEQQGYMGGGMANKMSYMQEGGSVLDMALRRSDPVQSADPEYQMVSSRMMERPSKYSKFNMQQEYLMPEYEKFRNATGNMFGFPENELIRQLNQSSQDYSKTQGNRTTRGYNPFFAVQEWAKRVDPKGKFKEGTISDEVALSKLKRLYSDYIADTEKASVEMGRMVYDANRGQFSRGNKPSASEKKQQPLKSIQASAIEVTDLIKSIVADRPIANKLLYNDSSLKELNDSEMGKLFEDQEQSPEQGTYDSGMMHGGMAKPQGYMAGGMANKMMYEDGGMASVDSMNNQSMDPMDRLRSSVDSYNQAAPQQIPAGAMAQLQERQMMEQQALEEAMYANAKQSLLELMMEDMKAKGMYPSDTTPNNNEYLKSLGGTNINSNMSSNPSNLNPVGRDSLMMFPSNPSIMMPR